MGLLFLRFWIGWFWIVPGHWEMERKQLPPFGKPILYLIGTVTSGQPWATAKGEVDVSSKPNGCALFAPLNSRLNLGFFQKVFPHIFWRVPKMLHEQPSPL